MSFLPIVAMIGIFYFLLIRPQRQQQKKADEMRNSLGKNDRVVTTGGIHGIVTGLTKSTVTVKVDDGVSIKFDRSSIATVTEAKGKKEEEAEETEEESSED